MTDAPDTSGSAGGWGADAVARFAPRRSFGLKLLLVCALAVLMSIPALFVFAINMDRSSRADEAINDVSQARGGRQQLVGPFLVVPYDREVVDNIPSNDSTGQPVRRVRVISSPLILYAASGAADVSVQTDVLRRGIHDVPVFDTVADFSARFDLTEAVTAAPPDALIRWSEARIYLGMSDLRGVTDAATVTINGDEMELSPASIRGGGVWSAGHAASSVPTVVGEYRNLSVMATPTQALDPSTPNLNVTSQIAFTGAGRLALAAFAQDTTVSMSSDWPSPSFGGGFLPDEREWGEGGFTASWRVPLLARGAPRAGGAIQLDPLLDADLGVEFLNESQPYTFVNRALKYSPMFVGLVFLTYFLFEATGGRRAHPAQYILVGLAQMVFYLLLIGVSEHLGFNAAFVIATSATVSLLALYSMAVFQTKRVGAQAFGVFATLYAMIFVLMRMQDYALLVGSIVCFLAIALTMWMTRDLNWYGGDDACA